jgi:hypothetical protein
MARREALAEALQKSIALLPPVLRNCAPAELVESVRPLFAAAHLDSGFEQPAVPRVSATPNLFRGAWREQLRAGGRGVNALPVRFEHRPPQGWNAWVSYRLPQSPIEASSGMVQ